MLLLTLLCGTAAAVLRGFQLVNSFDPQTSLIEPGDPLTTALIALSVLFVAGAAVYAFTAGGKKRPVKPLGKCWLAVEFAALAALFAASAYDLYTGFSDKPMRLTVVCLGILGLFAGAALLMIALSVNRLPFTSVTGFWATAPVFWACLTLIVDFWGHAGNPVRNTYVYGMLATVFCALALYTAAGFFFGRVKPGRALLYALPGVYFAALSAGGALLGGLIGDPLHTISFSALLRLVFIALHLSAAAAAVLYGRFTPPEPAEPEGAAEPENTEAMENTEGTEDF
ncbi:MAG: hypothetical protein LBH95_04245 [Oscillospiraceae bacterium]|jgi:hypothetical protein|nr:hypothetical protein [Oscillospiraceae bacterium]